ncbi:capsid scaffolding protein [Pseudomonas sp. PA-3-10C]|uniref:GPO family capsid scaffolding protein n=2 Tax=Pseudomonas TaxID=286 RepID=UPI001F2E06FD|nr:MULTISPECIES: GPO family capsid scaffolding protein [unclassified Pseudomonas]MCF5509261.1 capsid scaffolding protein [Pseudomonas sp. PA-3-6H]MCF5515274.1 capsid scaffolding protein [Pseudomonas sp. PA-3-6E]MCF5562718.1 capsid scaffolding protein [Pseudomonas sp. PA-3-5D]MCF5594766.1 capsid scaffolding protein [Pseudomonas sp. PA-3-10C]
MPRSLVSFWKRVATSGATVDGRVILPQELRDIAETYKPSLYTAVIWCDHERWPGSHGTVYAVRLVEEGKDLEPGEIALEAQLKPNDRLLYLNDQGQKLFSSIEITPDFRGSGKAYLTGLGVTDQPASVGTQELYFSNKNSGASYYAASVELGRFQDDSQPTAETGLINALTSFFKRLAADVLPTETTPPQTESKPPMDEATATALTALVAQLLVVAAGLQAVIEPAAEDAPAPDSDLIDDVSTAVDEIVATAEEEREFRRKGKGNQAVLAKLDALQKQFSALQNTSAGRQLPRNPGPVTTTKKKVL